jgi:hypothetical protein
MEFETILGYRVRDEKIVEQAERHEIDFEKVSYLRMLCVLMRQSKCPVLNFRSIKYEDRTKADRGISILTIYEGYAERENINVEKILKKFPSIFEDIKRDLGVEGGPEFYLAEP